MSQTTGLVILSVIAAALISAAMYAAFATPSDGTAKKRKLQIVDGFRVAGGILLGIFLMTCVVYGANFAILGGSPRVSRPIAAVAALIAFGLIALMVQRWAKYFAGFAIWGVYNSLHVATTGHAVKNPSVPVNRWYALGIGAVYLFSVLPTAHFTKSYKLHLIEKVALLLWILAFTASALFPKMDIAIISAGDVALVIAWWRYRSDQKRTSRATQLKHRTTTTQS